MAKVTSKDGVYITLKEATLKQEKHLKFRKEKTNENDPIRSQFFGRDKIEELLKKEGCVGIKIIYGGKDNNQPSLILTASDGDLNILANDSTGLKGGDDNSYLANGPECPNMCK